MVDNLLKIDDTKCQIMLSVADEFLQRESGVLPAQTDG